MEGYLGVHFQSIARTHGTYSYHFMSLLWEKIFKFLARDCYKLEKQVMNDFLNLDYFSFAVVVLSCRTGMSEEEIKKMSQKANEQHYESLETFPDFLMFSFQRLQATRYRILMNLHFPDSLSGFPLPAILLLHLRAATLQGILSFCEQFFPFTPCTPRLHSHPRLGCQTCSVFELSTYRR